MKALAIISEAALFYTQHLAFVAALGLVMSVLMAMQQPQADLQVPFTLALSMGATSWYAATARRALAVVIGEA